MEYQEAYNYIQEKLSIKDSSILSNYIDHNEISKGILFITKVTNCDENTAKLIWVDLCQYYENLEENFKKDHPEDYEDIKEIGKQIGELSKLIQPTPSNLPTCPICGSTNLTKLSNVGKAAKVGFFGIFGAGDLGKTWKCKNCGSKF